MKHQTIRKLVAVAVLSTAALMSHGITVDVTQVRQRYPWNGLVDIDYKLTIDDGEPALDPANDRIEFTIVNRAVSPATTNYTCVSRDIPDSLAAGNHRVTWNANADGVDFVSQDVVVFGSVVHYPVKYMVIDISGGPDTNVYPVTYLVDVSDGFLPLQRNIVVTRSRSG